MSLAGLAASPAAPSSRMAALGRLGLRYGASSAGPVAISAAHFLASFIFLRNLTAAEFGLFSFAIVAVSFCMSMTGALVALPVTANLTNGSAGANPVCFKFNWAMCAAFAIVLFAALSFSHAPLHAALLLGLFAALFAFRWFARCYAYVEKRMAAAIASDFLYSAVLVGGLALLALSHNVTFDLGSLMLALAAAVSLLPFGRRFFHVQINALRTARLAAYGTVFRDLTRWSLLGVVLTEMTVNAHAYLVTFIAGPGAFALLALGMLLMRPAALVQSALPDMERPAMARAIAARDRARFNRTLRDFHFGLSAVWLATIILSAVLLFRFPQLLLKKGYDLHAVAQVAGISAAIMLVRTFRTPPAILLQAAGEFKKLARIAGESAIVSLGATLALLFAFGPVASLGGILMGDLVILARVRLLANSWRREHV